MTSLQNGEEVEMTSGQRVALGASYMDANYPGWERYIDTGILDISHAATCICGQVISIGEDMRYSKVYEDLENYPDPCPSEGTPNVYKYGFVAAEDGDAWVSLIKDRFNLGILSDSDLI